MPDSIKSAWREALLWAIIAAIAGEFLMNFFEQRTLWQRITTLEHQVEALEQRSK